MWDPQLEITWGNWADNCETYQRYFENATCRQSNGNAPLDLLAATLVCSLQLLCRKIKWSFCSSTSWQNKLRWCVLKCNLIETTKLDETHGSIVPFRSITFIPTLAISSNIQDLNLASLERCVRDNCYASYFSWEWCLQWCIHQVCCCSAWRLWLWISATLCLRINSWSRKRYFIETSRLRDLQTGMLIHLWSPSASWQNWKRFKCILLKR